MTHWDVWNCNADKLTPSFCKNKGGVLNLLQDSQWTSAVKMGDWTIGRGSAIPKSSLASQQQLTPSSSLLAVMFRGKVRFSGILSVSLCNSVSLIGVCPLQKVTIRFSIGATSWTAHSNMKLWPSSIGPVCLTNPMETLSGISAGNRSDTVSLAVILIVNN